MKRILTLLSAVALSVGALAATATAGTLPGAVSPLTPTSTSTTAPGQPIPPGQPGNPLPANPPGSPAFSAASYGNQYDKFICENSDGQCLNQDGHDNPYAAPFARAITWPLTNTYLEQFTYFYMGSVSSQACWPFNCGSGMNAKWNGYAVYTIAEYAGGSTPNICLRVNGSNQMIFQYNVCGAGNWDLANEFVAIPDDVARPDMYSLANVIYSNSYNTTMVATAWCQGCQMSTDYYGPYQTETWYSLNGTG
jgi:hypothetical protein